MPRRKPQAGIAEAKGVGERETGSVDPEDGVFTKDPNYVVFWKRFLKKDLRFFRTLWAFILLFNWISGTLLILFAFHRLTFIMLDSAYFFVNTGVIAGAVTIGKVCLDPKRRFKDQLAEERANQKTL
jgi:hypothetical protein